MKRYIDPIIFEKYEFLNFGHALEILYEAFPAEWAELQECLHGALITTEDLLVPGGNETNIPKNSTISYILAAGEKLKLLATY